MKKALTIIKVVDKNYSPSSEDLEEILSKFISYTPKDINKQIIVHNILEEKFELDYTQISLQPKQLILFKVNQEILANYKDYIVDTIRDSLSDALDANNDNPFLIISKDIEVEVINLSNYICLDS